MAADGCEFLIWGVVNQTRSFLYVDECLEGTLRLMRSDFREPVNIGSDEMVSINDLAQMIAGVAGKSIRMRHVSGPLGVAGRNSDNRLIGKVLGWRPSAKLRDGIAKTYPWIAEQVRAAAAGRAGA